MRVSVRLRGEWTAAFGLGLRQPALEFYNLVVYLATVGIFLYWGICAHDGDLCQRFSWPLCKLIDVRNWEETRRKTEALISLSILLLDYLITIHYNVIPTRLNNAIIKIERHDIPTPRHRPADSAVA